VKACGKVDLASFSAGCKPSQLEKSWHGVDASSLIASGVSRVLIEIAVGVEGFQDQAIETVTQCRRLQFTVASVRPPITKTTVSAKVDFVGWHLSSVIVLDCTGFDHFPLASSVDGFDSAHLIRRKGDGERTLFDFRQGERFR
jgi:hypothetical protein